MKPLWIAVALLFSGVLLAGATTSSSSALHPTTAKNLDTAMHGEAFAYAKYLLFAEHARQSGHPEIAKLFEDTAKTERFEHLSEEAQLRGLVSTDEQNLREAIRGETYESEHMYADFAKQAQAVGDTQAAQRFEEIRKDEMKHRAAFQSELDKLAGHGLSGGK